MFSSKINLFQLLMLTMVLEYVPGTGDSLMLLYDFNLYYRVKKSTKWICSRSKCNVSLTINQEETEIDRKPTQHQHEPFTQCELDVRQAKKDMRTKAGESLEVKPRTAYSELVKSLTNKGHLLTDIGNAGLMSFQRSRNSINKSMVKSRNKLPKSLNEIDFSSKNIYTMDFDN